MQTSYIERKEQFVLHPAYKQTPTMFLAVHQKLRARLAREDRRKICEQSVCEIYQTSRRLNAHHQIVPSELD